MRRRRERALVALVALLFVACGAYGISYVSYLPQLTIAQVHVDGTQVVPDSIISAYADTVLYDGTYHFLSRQNIFNYPKQAIARDLVANFPRIASAAVSRPSLFSRTLDVTVTERQPFGLWCTSGASSEQCYVMDDTGFIYADAASSTGGYIFSGGIATSTQPIGQTFAPGHVPGLIALFKLLTTQDGLIPTGATVESGQDFAVTLSQGFLLKASYGEDANMLADDLELVLGSDALQGKTNDLEYVDLRFGDRVYYKLKGEDATSTPSQ
jgi:cell division septal protein FtsQ